MHVQVLGFGKVLEIEEFKDFPNFQVTINYSLFDNYFSSRIVLWPSTLILFRNFGLVVSWVLCEHYDMESCMTLVLELFLCIFGQDSIGKGDGLVDLAKHAFAWSSFKTYSNMVWVVADKQWGGLFDHMINIQSGQDILTAEHT